MLKREWQKILKNPWMIIILIAIITIPAIYTSVFLGSMWDPYGDADQLPVAVINHDKKVTYEGKTLQVGDDLVKNLKDSGSLDFHFVSDKKAEDGLKSGKYYMIISIPENFSKNATTLMDKNPKQMKLTYKTNPGTNYVASKMDDSAMAKIEKSVREKVTETYVKTVFAQIKTAGSGFQKAADGSKKIGSGAKKLKAGNDTIEQNLKKLASSTLTFQNGAKSLSVGLKSYTAGVAKVDSGAKSLKSGTKTLKDGVAKLSSGAGQLSTGSKSLKIGIAQYTNGVSSAQAGSSQLASNNKALNSGVEQLSSGSKELKSGTGTLTSGIKSVLSAAQTTSDTIGSSLDENGTKKDSIIDNRSSFNENLSEFNTKLQELNTALGNASQTETTSTKTTTADNEAAKKAANSASDAKASAASLKNKVSKLKNSSVLDKLSAEDKEALLAEIEDVDQEASNVESNVNDTYANAQEASNAKTTTTTTSSRAASDDQMATIKASVNALAQSSEKLLASSKQLSEYEKAMMNGLYNGLNQVKEGLDRQGTTQDTMGMIQALSQLSQGATKVQAGMTSLESGINNTTSGLKIGIANYTAGVDSLNTGLKTLKSNSKALNSGATQLNGGINQVSSKLPTFMSGTTQLYNGTKTLKSGTATLVANNNTLNNGAGQLASGAGQIADGSSKLASGSTTLGNGIGTLQSGSKTLKDSLQKGADQVNSIKATNKTNKMFAAPVKAKNVEYSHVDNNGHAMAPYMMSVGLFVACMAFTLMYPLMEKNEEVKSGLQWWLSKVTVMAAVSVVQAVIMVAVLIGINGLEPHYVGKTFGMAILASMAFMSLICFGEMLLNRVGSFVMLVFMVVQLGAAGGTYPLDMAPHFYTVLHKYMPFSYTVHAFRHTLSMDGQIGQDVAVFVGILVVSTLATIIFYRFRMKKQVGGTLDPNGVPQH